MEELTLVFPLFRMAFTPISISVALCFFAVLLLDSFDISLPRGDSIGVSGALTAAAIILFGPIWAASICIGSVVVTNLARHGAHVRRRAVAAVFARSAALLAGILTAYLLSLQQPRATLYNSLIVVALVPAAYLVTDLIGAQFVAAIGTGRPFARLLRGNIGLQAPLILAQWSASVLLLITYEGMGKGISMGDWGLIPAVALLFLIRQSYAMLLDIRELYRTTVEVLVEAAEAQDVRRVGHAERTAAAARAIAMRIGLSANRVERISYAALLHDIDAIGNTTELNMREGSKGPVRAMGTSSVVFEGVRFFDDVLPIIRICDGYLPDGPPKEDDLQAGLIVALASDVDAAQNSDVASAHTGNSVDRVAPWVSASVKSSVVGAALALGYRIPAVG